MGGEEQESDGLDAVQQCLEQLLSKENLAEDNFIQQRMNAQLYIPICVLANHHSMVKLGQAATMDTMMAAAQRSEKLCLDTDNLSIRPVMRQRRNTVILHDLPADISENELQELFKASPEFENLCSIKPDVNHTAFASFQTDDAAQTATLWLRSQKLRGDSVRCAIKSEHVMRSFFPAHPAGQGAWAHSGHMGAGGKGQAMGWPGPVQAWNAPAGPPWAQDVSDIPGGCSGFEGDGMSQVDDATMCAPSDLGLMADGEEVEVGYFHEFRSYARQTLIEICSSMREVTKPESFAKMEREDKNIALFRNSPCKDWAPLPTPMMSFASSMLGNEGRKGTGRDDDDLGAQSRKGSRPRKASGAGGRGSVGGGSDVNGGKDGGQAEKSAGKGGRRSGSTGAVWKDAPSGSSGAQENRASHDWNSWEWSSAGVDASWAPERSETRWRATSGKSSGWGDWHGQPWQEHGKGAKGAPATQWKVKTPAEPDAAAGSADSSVSKDKSGTAQGGRPSEGVDSAGGEAPDAKPAAVAGIEGISGAKVAAQAWGDKQPLPGKPLAAEKAADTSAEPAAAPALDAPVAPARPAAPSWADKVRLGSSGK